MPGVSAANASDLFDLRCNVREHLLAFLRTYESGKYLPRSRNETVFAAPHGSDNPR